MSSKQYFGYIIQLYSGQEQAIYKSYTGIGMREGMGQQLI
jgi:hypothetical protein